MRSIVLIAIATVAATSFGSAFAEAEDIALSLVNRKGRVDVPVSAIRRVEAAGTIAFQNTETGQVHEHSKPHIEVCFAADIRERICGLTRQIVGRPLEIVVNCATITKAIVIEPLCIHPCFQISVADIAEANALAQRIRRGSNRACAPSG